MKISYICALLRQSKKSTIRNRRFRSINIDSYSYRGIDSIAVLIDFIFAANTSTRSLETASSVRASLIDALAYVRGARQIHRFASIHNGLLDFNFSLLASRRQRSVVALRRDAGWLWPGNPPFALGLRYSGPGGLSAWLRGPHTSLGTTPVPLLS